MNLNNRDIFTGTNQLKIINDVENILAARSGPQCNENIDYNHLGPFYNLYGSEDNPPIQIRSLHSVDTRINLINVKALINSGAQSSIVSITFIECIKLDSKFPINVSIPELTLEMFNGQQMQCSIIVLNINVNGLQCNRRFTVMDNVRVDVTFEIDIIEDFGIKIPTHSVSKIKQCLSKYRMHSIKEMQLQEEAENLVAIQFHEDAQHYITELKDIFKKNEAINGIHSTLTTISITFVDENDRAFGSWSRQIQIPHDVAVSFEVQVKEWCEQNICEEITREMLDDSPGTGLFNTNCFLTFSGKWCFVHNFVPINRMIRGDTNDIPNIESIFHRIALSQAKIFSKIDLKSAYLQIPLNKSDRNITSFMCGNKRYRFQTVPLGLKHIPLIFQWEIQQLLHFSNCADFTCNFIDDIIIFSADLETHKKHVTMVLKALTSIFLTIQWHKCKFFCTQVPLLGYWITTEGIKPNYEKLSNILKWDQPNTHKKIQRFCGIVNFFRKFILNASEKMRPLLVMRDKKFNWTDYPELETVYKSLYESLIVNTPFLYFPVDGVPLELKTDASETVLSGALFQTINSEKRYLGFYSRVLCNSEMHYSIPRKEFLSIIINTAHFREYLMRRFFTLHTDAESLTYIFNSMDKPNAKDSTLAGWLSMLADFSFQVFHIEGERNVLADLCSRVQNVSIAMLSEQDQATYAIIRSVHEFGHFGANSMYEHIREMFEGQIPKNLMSLIRSYCKSCKMCQLVNDYRKVYAPPKEPELFLPLERVDMDLLTVPKTKEGYEYILVIIDRMSSFIWLTELVTKDGPEVADAAL
jgi:hypothetical protein